MVEGMSLSPPFIMSTAFSSTGVMAAGTADGRLWIGFGGEKTPSIPGTGKKRNKKWDGLDADAELLQKVADGPIVAMYVFTIQLCFAPFTTSPDALGPFPIPILLASPHY